MTRWFSRLRFPQLFTFTAILFLVDFLVPDMIPFLDEILLAAATLLLANMKGSSPSDKIDTVDKPPEKDVTPQE